MKNKFLSLSIIILLLICMSGCKESYPSETDMEYMVSSIGFDKLGQSITVFAEIIVVNSADSSKGAETKIFKADGKTPTTAIYNLHSLLSKPLMLKHCGLLILGDGVDRESVAEIFNICLNNKDITGAIKIVATKSAEDLINIKPTSNIAIGYEISEALKQNSNFSGLVYKNRFYEVESKRESKTDVFCLPYFNVEDENFKIDGIKIYRKDTPFKNLNSDQSGLYSIMSDSFSKGTVKIKDSSFLLELKSVKYDIEYKKGKLFVNVRLDVIGDKNKLKLLAEQLENTEIEETDIYYISDRVYRKERKIWEDIKDDYERIFQNAEIIFKVD